MKRLIVFTLITTVICLFASHLTAQDLVAKKNETSGKWGFADKQGKVVIPYKYDYCVEFENAFKYGGLAVVRIDDNRGLIDKTGKEIIPLLYRKIHFLGNADLSVLYGFAVVSELSPARGDTQAFFDVSGKQITPFEYTGFAISQEDNSLFGKYQGGWVKINKEDGTRTQ